MHINFNKKTFIILTLIWLIITFNLIKSTYAKYLTELNTNTNISISRWDISVNNQNIIDSNNISSVLSLQLVENDYIKNDVVVPGSVGYIDLNIDSSNTNVDFTTEIDISVDEDSDLTEDFIIFGYSTVNSINEITDDTEITELSNDSSFSYDISKNTSNTLIRIYVTWEDDGTDSAQDTALGISTGILDLKINLTFKQKINQVVQNTITNETLNDINL